MLKDIGQNRAKFVIWWDEKYNDFGFEKIYNIFLTL